LGGIAVNKQTKITYILFYSNDICRVKKIEKMYKSITATEAVKQVKDNNRIYVQAAAATPNILLEKLTERHSELKNVELCHLHTEG